MKPLSETPASLGFRMPAEWDRHDATWIAWPHNEEDWPDKFGPIPWVYADIVKNLALHERVEILVDSGRRERGAGEILERTGVAMENVRFHRIKTDRVWTRDTGPTVLINQSFASDVAVGLVDWRFNGWAKYENHELDDKVPKKIASALHLNRWVPRVEIDGESRRVVLEGGSIDVNGKGTLLTTEECLLSTEQERNPGLTREGYEKVLADYLGIKHVVWLGEGILGDDTHGHVDDLARFVNPTTIVVAQCAKSDENYERLADNLKRLKAARDQDGNPFEVVPLPMPRPVVFEGQRLPASYANFYIANNQVLVPTFNDPADFGAIAILRGLFPNRDVVGIHCLDLVWGLGTLHCMTQQQPAPGTSTVEA